MRKVALALLVLAVGCGDSKKKPVPVPVPKAPAAAPIMPGKGSEVKSDPNGKYTCIVCTLKTNEDHCPKCKTALKASESPKAHAPGSGTVGKSAMSAVYACPEAGCTFTDPRKGTCLKHSTVQMKEQWYVCEKDSAKEPVAGKCSKCGAELQKKLF